MADVRVLQNVAQALLLGSVVRGEFVFLGKQLREQRSQGGQVSQGGRFKLKGGMGCHARVLS